MAHNRRETRLRNEHELLKGLKRKSRLIDFQAYGDPPDRYTVVFYCTGMSDASRQVSEHTVKVYLPADYPKHPPKVSFLSKCFHPNIMALFQDPSIGATIDRALFQAQAAGPEARRHLLAQLDNDSDLWEAHVCLDVLGYNWTPDITLEQICIELAEMIQYKRYNTEDPLNPAAARWAKENRDLLPIDHRQIVDPADICEFEIRFLSEVQGDGAEVPLIKILGGNRG